MRKIRKSLLLRFVVLIVIALGFLQMMMVVYMVSKNYEKINNNQTDLVQIEKDWTTDVSEATPKTLDDVVDKWHKKYSQAQFFYVDGAGNLQQDWHIKIKEELPQKWQTTNTVKFMQEHYDGNPYTVIRFVGNDESNGFLAFQMPRSEVTTTKVDENFIYVGIFFLVLYLVISLIFFNKILRRLIKLEKAMAIRENGLPVHTLVTKEDEIGALEIAFNKMVDELSDAKLKQEEEEQFRRELIANLSHDLKTPLTKMRGTIQNLPEEDKLLIDGNIDKMNELIENLMSYTLLTANKLEFNIVTSRVDRLVTESIASWYPVFEERGFEVEVDLTKLSWEVDESRFLRVLDNVFQNVLRHADSGKFISVSTQNNELIIQDHGPGIESHSDNKGAGIGLSIVNMMTERMKITFKIESNELGTKVVLSQK